MPVTVGQTKSVNSSSVTTISTSEFYYSGETSTGVYTSPDGFGDIVGELQNGYVVKVKDISGKYGLVTVGGRDGWVLLDELLPADDVLDITKGDVNKDGIIDRYDLSLVNEYIRSLKYLPEGISLLSSLELQAADINSDGTVDKDDVLEYLTLICK